MSGSDRSTGNPALVAQPSGQKAATSETLPQTEQPDPYQLRNLIAQEEMAYWAMWMFVAAVLTFAITSIGTYLIWRQVKLTRQAVQDTSEATEAMREANEIASDTAKRQLRAYISCTDCRLFHITMGGPTFISFNLHNDGATPAYEVRLICRMQLSNEGPEKFRMMLRDAGRDGNSVSVVNPGRSNSQTTRWEIPAQHMQAMFNPHGGVTLIFAGVVSYRDAFGRRRLTTFRYFLDPNTIPTKDEGYMLTVCGTGNNAN